MSALKTLALTSAMMGDAPFSYEAFPEVHSKEKAIKHTKHSKDGRKVEYYTDEKGNIKRRKVVE